MRLIEARHLREGHLLPGDYLGVDNDLMFLRLVDGVFQDPFTRQRRREFRVVVNTDQSTLQVRFGMLSCQTDYLIHVLNEPEPPPPEPEDITLEQTFTILEMMTGGAAPVEGYLRSSAGEMVVDFDMPFQPRLRYTVDGTEHMVVLGAKLHDRDATRRAFRQALDRLSGELTSR